MCSSVAKIEFLKYREFAYAGVVPVGDLPATYLDCPADAYVPSRRNFIALTRQIKAVPDSEAMAARYRKFVRELRHVDKMRANVTAALASL